MRQQIAELAGVTEAEFTNHCDDWHHKIRGRGYSVFNRRVVTPGRLVTVSLCDFVFVDTWLHAYYRQPEVVARVRALLMTAGDGIRRAEDVRSWTRMLAQGRLMFDIADCLSQLQVEVLLARFRGPAYPLIPSSSDPSTLPLG